MRTYRASQKGIEEAKKACKNKSNLAANIYNTNGGLGISRTTLTKFFKKEPVRCEIFQNICKELGLTWRLIVDCESAEIEPMPEIHDVVQTTQKNASKEILKLSALIPIEIRQAVQEKMKLDFALSPLSTPATGNNGINKSLDIAIKSLEIARIIDKSKTSYEQIQISTGSWHGSLSDEAMRILNNHGEISIRCSCISTGAIAVIKSLQEVINIRLYYEDLNGQMLVEQMANNNKEYDFIIVANSPVLLADNDNIKEYLKRYKLVLPCFSVRQHIFKHKLSRTQKRISILKGSSQEEHFRYLLYHSARSILFEPEFIKDNMAFYFNKFDDDKDAVFIAWEPMASNLEKTMKIEKIQNMSYSSWVCLYSVWTEDSELTRAFKEVFVATWIHCNWDLKYAYQLLAKDSNYLLQFAVGSGMKIPDLSSISHSLFAKV